MIHLKVFDHVYGMKKVSLEKSPNPKIIYQHLLSLSHLNVFIFCIFSAPIFHPIASNPEANPIKQHLSQKSMLVVNSYPLCFSSYYFTFRYALNRGNALPMNQY